MLVSMPTELIPGQRVELTWSEALAYTGIDPNALVEGDRGTVTSVVDVGLAGGDASPGEKWQVKVRWDRGQIAKLWTPPDTFRILTPPYPTQPWRHFEEDARRPMFVGLEPIAWLLVRDDPAALLAALGDPEPDRRVTGINAFGAGTPWGWGTFQETEGRIAFRPLGLQQPPGMDLDFLTRIGPFCAAPFTATLYDYEAPPMWRVEHDGQALTLSVGEVVWRQLTPVPKTW
jgi:hypothetical protein